MDIEIFDINNDLIDECKAMFGDTEIVCRVVRVEDLNTPYIVTAGNSLGIMRGGIDLAIKNHFGSEIEDKVQEIIKSEWNGFLPVGKFILVPLNDNQTLLYTPTMAHPGTLIDEEDVYFIACKLFRFVKSRRGGIDGDVISICGLGTSTGGIDNSTFASMVYRAYEDVIGDSTLHYKGYRLEWAKHSLQYTVWKVNGVCEAKVGNIDVDSKGIYTMFTADCDYDRLTTEDIHAIKYFLSLRLVGE